MSMSELGRLTAVDGQRQALALDPGHETIVVENQLSAVIYAAFGRQPSVTEFDFVVPGSALFTIPVVGGQDRLSLLVDYAGAVPAGDVQAIVWATECRWPPFVGPLV